MASANWQKLTACGKVGIEPRADFADLVRESVEKVHKHSRDDRGHER